MITHFMLVPRSPPTDPAKAAGMPGAIGMANPGFAATLAETDDGWTFWAAEDRTNMNMVSWFMLGEPLCSEKPPSHVRFMTERQTVYFRKVDGWADLLQKPRPPRGKGAFRGGLHRGCDVTRSFEGGHVAPEALLTLPRFNGRIYERFVGDTLELGATDCRAAASEVSADAERLIHLYANPWIFVLPLADDNLAGCGTEDEMHGSRQLTEKELFFKALLTPGLDSCEWQPVIDVDQEPRLHFCREVACRGISTPVHSLFGQGRGENGSIDITPDTSATAFFVLDQLQDGPFEVDDDTGAWRESVPDRANAQLFRSYFKRQWGGSLLRGAEPTVHQPAPLPEAKRFLESTGVRVEDDEWREVFSDWGRLGAKLRKECAWQRLRRGDLLEVVFTRVFERCIQGTAWTSAHRSYVARGGREEDGRRELLIDSNLLATALCQLVLPHTRVLASFPSGDHVVLDETDAETYSTFLAEGVCLSLTDYVWAAPRVFVRLALLECGGAPETDEVGAREEVDVVFRENWWSRWYAQLLRQPSLPGLVSARRGFTIGEGVLGRDKLGDGIANRPFWHPQRLPF